MKKKFIYLLFIVLATGTFFISCEKENYENPDSAKLSFSTDTVMFDTIFTVLGSTTKSFRVINPYNQPLVISSIKLAGGDQSAYRLNIDGDIVNEVKNLELRTKDSIFIFVEVTVDPNGVNQPMIVQDSIIFTIDGNQQDIDLISWGQDFKPIRAGSLKTTTWTSEKPYLVFDSVIVEKDQLLTIEAGTMIYFHYNAYLRVYGAIHASGTPDLPIVFEGDRLEYDYYDVPNQWVGIFIDPSPVQSIFTNVEIKNGMVGLDLGDLYKESGASVKLHNVKIEHMTFYGIRSIKSKIEATNTLIADCGYYCLFLLGGGSFDFNHCTIANYWGSVSHRTTPAVALANFVPLEKEDIPGDLIKADWHNTIIYGNNDYELILADNGQNSFECLFDHCLIKVSDSIYNSHRDQFRENLRYVEDSLLFTDAKNYNYMPDSLSPIRSYALRSYAEKIPLDLANISRLDDSAPDIGAYEYIYIKKEEEKE